MRPAHVTDDARPGSVFPILPSRRPGAPRRRPTPTDVTPAFDACTCPRDGQPAMGSNELLEGFPERRRRQPWHRRCSAQPFRTKRGRPMRGIRRKVAAPHHKMMGVAVAAGVMLVRATQAWSAEAKVDSGDTAWMLTSAALVLMMTAPGLALFYGGLVRSKNVLNLLMQSFIMIALISVQWVLWGYSLAFGPDHGHVLGGLDWLGLSGVGLEPNADYAPTIPHQAFMIYQAMFAIITPALITGAFAERMKFSAFLVFSLLWATLVYDPLAHMVWGTGGLLGKVWGALDFAGGTVVHISSGTSALVCAFVIGRRLGYGSEPMPPHN